MASRVRIPPSPPKQVARYSLSGFFVNSPSLPPYLTIPFCPLYGFPFGVMFDAPPDPLRHGDAPSFIEDRPRCDVFFPAPSSLNLSRTSAFHLIGQFRHGDTSLRMRGPPRCEALLRMECRQNAIPTLPSSEIATNGRYLCGVGRPPKFLREPPAVDERQVGSIYQMPQQHHHRQTQR